MSIGPDFTKKVVDALAKRAAQICSNPDCHDPTSARHSNPAQAVILGEAAHIKGARPTSARYDPNMTDQERSHPSNGIWLCVPCAKKIDKDESIFPVELLKRWKAIHEAWVADGCPSKKENQNKVVMRPARLKVRNEVKSFLHFCSTYWTMHCQGMVKGSNDLIRKLHSFEKSVDAEGPLSIPNLESRIKEIITNVWKMQRLVDRLAGPNPRPLDSTYDTAEDNVDALVEWFAQQEKEIDELLEPYLTI